MGLVFDGGVLVEVDVVEYGGLDKEDGGVVVYVFVEIVEDC